MAKLILITGGARSGKSRLAEKTADVLSGEVLYVATAKATDAEMTGRIEHHKNDRPAKWGVFEGYKGFEKDSFVDLCKNYGAVLVDCLTIMCTNIIMEQFEDPSSQDYLIDCDLAQDVETKVLIEVNSLMNSLEEAGVDAIFVTNEVGMGLVPEYPLGRLFRDIAGRVNQRVADRAQEVYFCVSGISMKIK
ncbi:MAG: bifunctional adenosylcobinamide kinase/adenosylcobinamide-phosphate guanylyltransferase [Bacillota bacterium]